MLRNRVLLVLTIAGLAGGSGLAFLREAPNRLVSGQPVSLADTLHGAHALILLPALLLLVGPFLPQRRAVQALLALSAAAFLVALVWLAGSAAAALAAHAPRAARTALGGGFW